MKIQEGEKIPYGYGFAWPNYESRTAEVFIIPFNYILRWIRSLWFKTLTHPNSLETKAFLKGHREGYKVAEEFYKRKIDKINEEWNRTVGKVILAERFPCCGGQCPDCKDGHWCKECEKIVEEKSKS